jgi:hypothetical protein
MATKEAASKSLVRFDHSARGGIEPRIFRSESQQGRVLINILQHAVFRERLQATRTVQAKRDYK